MDSLVLQFEALQSTVDIEFWSELGKRKLNDLRLSEEPLHVRGFLSAAPKADIPGLLQLARQSFLTESHIRAGTWAVPGVLHNVNTLERFKTFDRTHALQELAAAIWEDILTGAAERDPTLLGRFVLVSYADLKVFKMYYWFCFPALKPPEPFRLKEQVAPLGKALGNDVASKVLSACEAWREGRSPSDGENSHGKAPVWLVSLVEGPEGMQAESHAVQDWPQVGMAGEVLLAIEDTGAGATYPGWSLRNVLLMAAMRWGWLEARVVCVRGRPGRADPSTTLLLSVQLPNIPPDWGMGGPDKVPASVGWEVNAKGKMGPRMVDLGPSMDPRRLAESAVDLNLRLMRWRAAPGLDTDRLAATRCLLLGAGTLGCAVARTLLGWGVRHISMVDYGRVAFSNPARQSLYEFNDCLSGGKPKAAAAAEALARIFPSVVAQGIELAIPMPGHPLPTPMEVAQAEEAFKQLQQLVEEHDVVFLLMDTRESRWLPTLLAAAAGKLAINAALGFDSFLVMRHGAEPSPGEESTAAPKAGGSHRLGCYFCNDVVAPLNSTVDRTLDQMCTVARPGLAPIAGALAVEVMAAALTHPAGVAAPPPSADVPGPDGGGSAAEALPLGAAPHIIRGQLSGGFSQAPFIGHAFSQCTACSSAVVSRFRSAGWPFVLDALQDPKSLEDLTGLTELHASTAAMMEGFDDLDIDDDCDGGPAGIQEGDDSWESL